VSNNQARVRRWTDTWLPAGLLILAGVGWWWTAVSAAAMRGDAMPMDSMPTMSFAAFLIAWAAMMAAMMLPAVLPAVRRYAHAADGNAAPAIVFVTAYLALWSATGIPAYLAWSRLNEPMSHPHPWVGRLAGALAVAAGLYQLTPLKTLCLRHCRSPIPLWHGNHLDRAARAFLAGGRYGIFCLGSCWMLFILLIALGTMQLTWMLALSVVIWLERLAPIGDRLTRVTAAMLLALGVAVLVHPALVTHLI
jgi:predicted metal-binding membrane protein